MTHSFPSRRSSDLEVDEAHAKLTEVKDQYGIKTIMPVQMQHGVYSFYFECLNSSWWEIEYYDGFLHDDFFDFGDRYTDSVLERETTPGRSEEHTSELQSLMRTSYAVFCLKK